MNKDEIIQYKEDIEHHLKNELLPFWLDRCRDDVNGGYITHFDKDGNDTGEDQKSLIAQARTVYSMSAAHRAGYGDGKCADYAAHGVDFLIDRMWDDKYGGFFWTVNRKGEIEIDRKILYGLSFAMYALSEYTMATGDKRGMKYAGLTFDLVQKYCADTMFGGYFEMFQRDWTLSGPGSGGGDRKTLDVHMHLMEAFTNLFECSGEDVHKRKLKEDIQLLISRILHPEFMTGIPQFTIDWKVAPQIKFDIIWGWDRYTESGEKENAEDNTAYGHNVEFAWLLLHALDVMAEPVNEYEKVIHAQLEHAVVNGIDDTYGGVYVEGPHAGGVYDREKEFWQQAEVMIGMLEACLRYDADKYWPFYQNVHRFVFDRMINHEIGEWWPLLSREGEPIWTHMSHSWKVNYHSIRSMLQCAARHDKLLEKIQV
ncbi:MAG: AGE family epimerase/isomerase [candidate division KSB1 bacterium]|jgi:mannobiose 2-epimerase|nr:AGE family epimerase/isomerase [candidate division KSB1 bacterium]